MREKKREKVATYRKAFQFLFKFFGFHQAFLMYYYFCRHMELLYPPMVLKVKELLFHVLLLIFLLNSSFLIRAYRFNENF